MAYVHAACFMPTPTQQGKELPRKNAFSPPLCSGEKGKNKSWGRGVGVEVEAVGKPCLSALADDLEFPVGPGRDPTGAPASSPIVAGLSSHIRP